MRQPVQSLCIFMCNLQEWTINEWRDMASVFLQGLKVALNSKLLLELI